MAVSTIIGIDFGTTTSAVGVFQNGRVEVVPNRHGDMETPSVVAFTRDGIRLVGRRALEYSILHPESAAHRVKLELGGTWTFEHAHERHSAEEVASWVLNDLRESAEAHLGRKVSRAVLTVPAQFNLVQRTALAEAAERAGIEAVRMLNEPTAAALHYGFGHGEEHAFLVFDMGGGTLDVSVVEVGDGVVQTRGTGGDSNLGGANWDRRIADRLLAEFARQHGFRPNDRAALRRLEDAAEKAKIELSSAGSTAVSLPCLAVDGHRPVHLETTLTRTRLETMTQDLLLKCEQPVRQALDAPFGINDMAEVDRFILAGAATRMPMIARLARKLTRGREPQRAVGPYAVASGAALQGALIGGQLNEDLLLLDVMSLPLGIETGDERMCLVIDRDTTIPSRRSEVFTTVWDGQAVAQINVHQGRRSLARYNKKLAVLELALPPAPRGEPSIEVAFDIDANTVLHVSAKNLDTGETVSVRPDLRTAAHAALQRSDPDKAVVVREL
ncbi:Hsp70 family protein [Streptomyces sp. B1-3]|uniref:Hsp70 family protein n=1 Tax=Streptomyces sp. B1-3 TaxID=3141453 RepID=UPI003D26B6BD